MKTCGRMMLGLGLLLLAVWAGAARGAEIHDAAKAGDVEKVAALIKADPQAVDARSCLAWSIKLVMVCPTVGQMDVPFLIVVLPKVEPGPLVP